MGSDIILVLLFIIISLLVGIVLKVLLKKTFVPYTVGLFMAGFCAGLIERFGIIHMSQSIDTILYSVGNLNPDAILYIFLPILIFEASMNMDIHIFRKSIINATILSVPGVIVCLLLTGAMIIFMQHIYTASAIGWTWTTALMFGALISATDPVAVVAILNELKTSKSFSTLVDSESMLNDGTGIVFFMLFFSAFTASGIEHGPIIGFIITVFGAILSGYIVALISLWGASHYRRDPILQNTILIIASYILFYCTNMILEISGVIALVTFGIVVAYNGPTILRPKANEFIKQFWELAAYVANTLIFIIVGIIIAMKCDFIWSNFGILFLVYIGINIIRGIMIFIFYPIMKRQQYGITVKEGFVLTWSGLRGALGLTLALLVFYTPTIPASIRHQILFLTGGVVTLTLLINATSIGWVIKKLKLSTQPSARILLDYNIKAMYKDKMMSYFEEMKKEPNLCEVDWIKLRQYLPDIGENPVSNIIPLPSLIATIRRKLMGRCLSKILFIYQEGIISARSYQRLSSLIEDLDDSGGEAPFTDLIHSLNSFKNPQKKWVKFIAFSYKITGYLKMRLVNRYDELNGIIFILKDTLRLIDDMKSLPPFNDEGIRSLTIIEEEIAGTIKAAEKQVSIFSANYPIAYSMSINEKAKRILLRKERTVIKDFTYSGMLSEDEEEKMLGEVGKKRKKEI